MKKTKKLFIIFISLILCVISLVSATSVNATAIDSFEEEISSFPESYKPYLRTLHEKYPNWKFVAVDTGLDWNLSTEMQYRDDMSLVSSSSSDLFKSRESDDYNAETDTYISKDSGFVKANRLAIEYYMDPRNFLNEEGIFQFERLSFNSALTVETVEGVLKGSFMYDTKISYWGGKVKEQSDGTFTYVLNEKKTSTDETYAEVIYHAGKKYNINPCYLASKILNEVGAKGSASVTGQQATYPGIYNFYNIGAYDGGNPIEKGLKWAASNGTYADSTYGRPWISPRKSIINGANFVGEQYIDLGQNTSYFQRFNVSPSAKKTKFTHQYMTNLAGAAAPAYSTYLSYEKSGVLQSSFVFEIPVYKNMPQENLTSGKISYEDSANLSAKAWTNCNVRTGPSTLYSKAGFSIVLGDKVQILETVFTDNKNPNSVSSYPYWSKISCVKNGNTYTGYVYSNYFDFLINTYAQIGDFEPFVSKNTPETEFSYVSSDSTVARICNATVNTTCNIRLGPSTTYGKLEFQLPQGTYVEIINSSSTSSAAYPIWHRIRFNYNNKTYTGYVFSGYLDYCADKIVFLKKGTVDITAYNSMGYYGKARYSVLEVLGEKGISQPVISSIDDTTATVSFDTGSYYKTFELNLTNSVGEIIKRFSTTEASINITGLKPGETYYVYLRGFNNSKRFSPFTSALKVVTTDSGTIPAPTLPVAVNDGYIAVKISWKAVDAADGYRVFVYDEKNKTYTMIAQTEATENVYYDATNSVIKNTGYSVVAFRTVGNEEIVSEYSPVCKYTPPTIKPQKVTGLKQSDSGSGKVKLSWKKIDGVSGYSVYLYNSEKKKYELYKRTSNTSITVSGLKYSSSYKFKVRAYLTVYGKDFGGSFSSVVTAYTAPAKVGSLKQSSVTSTSLTLSWKGVSGATGYRIYYYNTKSKSYKKLKDVSSTKYKITGLSSGEERKFKVKAYRKVGSKTFFATSSDAFEATTKPSKVTGITVSKATSSSYKLSWKAATGAEKYVIYRLNKSTGKYVKVTSTTKKYITLKGLKSNTKHTYVIKSLSVSDNAKVYGSKSAAVSAKTLKK